jgi:hypothetical protein
MWDTVLQRQRAKNGGGKRAWTPPRRPGNYHSCICPVTQDALQIKGRKASFINLDQNYLRQTL